MLSFYQKRSFHLFTKTVLLTNLIRSSQQKHSAFTLSEWYLPRVLTDRLQTSSEIMEELKQVTLADVMEVSEKITLDTVYTLTGKGAGK